MDSNTLIEGCLKFRDGRKWKSRWGVLTKLSPVADCLHLQLYRDGKDRYKQSQTKASLSLQHFLASESGFTLDKESNTIAIICLDVTVVLAFDSRERLIQWQVKIATNLGEGVQFLMQVASAPAKAKVPTGPVRLHLQDRRFCITAGVPPRLLGHWEMAQLRRYGVVDGKFCFEGGSRCGRGEGLHVLVSDQSQEVSNTFDLASQGRLSDKKRPLIRKMTVDSPRKHHPAKNDACISDLSCVDSFRPLLQAEITGGCDTCPMGRDARSAEELGGVVTSASRADTHSPIWSSAESARFDLESCDTMSVAVSEDVITDCTLHSSGGRPWTPASPRTVQRRVGMPGASLERCASCISKIGSIHRDISRDSSVLFSPTWTMDGVANLNQHVAASQSHLQHMDCRVSDSCASMACQSHANSQMSLSGQGKRDGWYDRPRNLSQGPQPPPKSPQVLRKQAVLEHSVQPGQQVKVVPQCGCGCESPQMHSPQSSPVKNAYKGPQPQTSTPKPKMAAEKACMCYANQPHGAAAYENYDIPRTVLTHVLVLQDPKSRDGLIELPPSRPPYPHPQHLQSHCHVHPSHPLSQFHQLSVLSHTNCRLSQASSDSGSGSDYYDTPRRVLETLSPTPPRPEFVPMDEQVAAKDQLNMMANYDTIPSSRPCPCQQMPPAAPHEAAAPVQKVRLSGEGRMPVRAPDGSLAVKESEVVAVVEAPKEGPTYTNVEEATSTTDVKEEAVKKQNNYANMDFTESLEFYENSRDVLNRAGLGTSASSQQPQPPASAESLCQKCGHTIGSCQQQPPEELQGEYLVMRPGPGTKEEAVAAAVPPPVAVAENEYLSMKPVRQPMPLRPFPPVNMQQQQERSSSMPATGRDGGMHQQRSCSADTRRQMAPSTSLSPPPRPRKPSPSPAPRARVPEPSGDDKGDVALRRSSSVPCKAVGANRDSAGSSDSGVSAGSPRTHDGELTTSTVPLSNNPLHQLPHLVSTSCLHSSLPRKGSRPEEEQPQQQQQQQQQQPPPQPQQQQSRGNKAEGEAQTQRRKGDSSGSQDEQLASSSTSSAPVNQDARSTSSGTSDMSDYIETLSLSSHSSSDAPDGTRLCQLGARPATSTLRPRSGKEYQKVDRGGLWEGDVKHSY